MLREAALSTATNASSPDTAIGWGVLQAQDASNYDLISVSDNRTGPTVPAKVMIAISSVPNPFNPVTAIRIELTPLGGTGLTERGGSQTTLDVAQGNPGFDAGIYDVAGRLVKDFGRLRFEGNSSTVIWDGRDVRGKPLPSGIYFFTVASGEASKTKKLALLR